MSGEVPSRIQRTNADVKIVRERKFQCSDALLSISVPTPYSLVVIVYFFNYDLCQRGTLFYSCI